MATVPHKAFFAQLDGVAGILTKPGDEVLFFNTEMRQYVTVTTANAMRVIVLDEVGHFMAQYYADRAAAHEERLALQQVAA